MFRKQNALTHQEGENKEELRTNRKWWWSTGLFYRLISAIVIVFDGHRRLIHWLKEKRTLNDTEKLPFAPNFMLEISMKTNVETIINNKLFRFHCESRMDWYSICRQMYIAFFGLNVNIGSLGWASSSKSGLVSWCNGELRFGG